MLIQLRQNNNLCTIVLMIFNGRTQEWSTIIANIITHQRLILITPEPGPDTRDSSVIASSFETKTGNKTSAPLRGRILQSILNLECCRSLPLALAIKPKWSRQKRWFTIQNKVAHTGPS